MDERSLISRFSAKVASLARGGLSCARTDTAVDGLAVWHSTIATSPEPAMFDPRFYVVLQGSKSMHFGDQRIDMAPGCFAMSSVGVPFVTAVRDASSERPYLGIGLELDPGLISELLLDMPAGVGKSASSVAYGDVDDKVLEAVERLFDLSFEPGAAVVLASSVKREIHFRLLAGPAGGTLRQIVNGGARFRQIKAAVELLRRRLFEPLNVPSLANEVGMSLTSFHRHFKAITKHSPLSYQKHYRLVQARSMITAGRERVTEVAYTCGYSHASQFSRDYKRMFGVSPRDESGESL